MKNAIIFHSAGNNSQGNWFPWLKSELTKHGYKTWVPDFPNSDKPNKKAWVDVIINNREWVFDKDTVFVGLSAGGTCILRVLEQLPKGVKIHKAILVAAPVEKGTIPEYFQYKEDLVAGGFEWETIKQKCEKFYFFASDNDPYECGIDQAKILHRYLGGSIEFHVGEGHFNLEKSSKYKQFPLLLEKILE